MLHIQRGEAQQLASQAIGLCDEINRSGHHIREEDFLCRNGERGRTLIPNEIHNLMIEILRIDADEEEEEEEEEEASESEATAAPDDEEEAEDTDGPEGAGGVRASEE